MTLSFLNFSTVLLIQTHNAHAFILGAAQGDASQELWQIRKN